MSNQPNTAAFELPVPGKSSCRVILPLDISRDDWKMIEEQIEFYLQRVFEKREQDSLEITKAKGETHEANSPS